MTPSKFQIAPSVKVILPTKKYPHLKQAIKELDFLCANCSSAHGSPVHVPFMEALMDPISGPGKTSERILLRCPECSTVPQDGPFFEAPGIINLSKVPVGYKKGPRPNNSSGPNVVLDGDEDDEMLQPTVEPIRRPKSQREGKKITDMSKPKR
jgi:hypothetical protein